MSWISGWRGDQPSSWMIFSGVAIKIPGSPGRRLDDFVSDRPADHLLAGAKHLEYGRAGSRTHVIRPAHTRLQAFDGQLMRLGQIFGMNIVPHAGSITGWIVTAVDEEFFATANGHLEDQGDQVALVAAVFTVLAIGIGTEALK